MLESFVLPSVFKWTPQLTPLGQSPKEKTVRVYQKRYCRILFPPCTILGSFSLPLLTLTSSFGPYFCRSLTELNTSAFGIYLYEVALHISIHTGNMNRCSWAGDPPRCDGLQLKNDLCLVWITCCNLLFVSGLHHHYISHGHGHLCLRHVLPLGHTGEEDREPLEIFQTLQKSFRF